MLDWLFSDPLPEGTPAPGFTLPDQDGKAVSLSALRGQNVVLVFYPADDTGVCTIQLGEFRDEWAEVKARNAVVFGVNSDSAAKHLTFKEKQQLPFPLLVDEGQQVARLYHANRPMIVKRTVYLIGPDGVIRYARRGRPAPHEVLKAAL
jgi:thioredoxin-dependent peroxiredoxin